MAGEGDCEELSLELSIGGKYGKVSENLREKSRDLRGQNANCERRYDFSEPIDAQRRKEIQALRRQEAQRKGEEKVRKSRGVANVVGLVHDKLFLEEQRFRERARDREIKVNDLLFEGGKGGGEAADELGLSLFSDEKNRENGCLYPNVQLMESKSTGSENSDGVGVKSLERCSSAVSDYRSISHKGGSSSDAGSPSRPVHDSLWQAAETDQRHKLAPIRSPESSPQVRFLSSGGEAPEASSCLPHMPCVSATGDGPNGRTVIGFLYKYDKREVSIMCVCHGSSFSPAHITVVT